MVLARHSGVTEDLDRVSLGLSTPALSYCCVQGGRAAGAPGAAWGAGNLAADPLFADPASGDYRLRSTAGRWDGTRWTLDELSSPALDAGDPADDATAESAPNGGRANLGFDGNTPFASRSPVVPLAFVLEPATLALAEGGAAAVTVSLSRAPATARYIGGTIGNDALDGLAATSWLDRLALVVAAQTRIPNLVRVVSGSAGAILALVGRG